MLLEIKENKNPKVFKMHLNKDNILYILPLTDRIQLIYGINFNQAAEIILTKVFLQELVRAKNHVKNCIDAKIFIDNDPIPNDIKNVVGNDKYSNGLLVFDFYVKDYNILRKKFNIFITLREFIQYHIHYIKKLLHIRMNRKGKEIEKKLNDCRIIPIDYIRSLEIQAFFDN